MPTVLDWMRPNESETLVKQIDDEKDDTKSGDGSSDSDFDDDSDSSSDEPVCIHTRSWKKKHESESDDEVKFKVNHTEPDTDEPTNQEIDRQSDSDSSSFELADSGSDGEDGRVGTHSTPLAQRKPTRLRQLPAKFDGFILSSLKQLTTLLEDKFLGKVYTSNTSQLCV